MRAKRILASIAMICSAAALAPNTWAQTTRSVWDGVYTDAQADRGSGQYTQHCAVCHGVALEGNGETPPLVGQFIPDWAGTTLADLYDKIQVTMPLNAPGTLRPAIAADILAFILKANNFPSGPNELGPASDSLKSVTFDVFKPKPVTVKGKAAPK
jgi:mono/diheme cytochrome c family protein